MAVKKCGARGASRTGAGLLLVCFISGRRLDRIGVGIVVRPNPLSQTFDRPNGFRRDSDFWLLVLHEYHLLSRYGVFNAAHRPGESGAYARLYSSVL